MRGGGDAELDFPALGQRLERSEVPYEMVVLSAQRPGDLHTDVPAGFKAFLRIPVAENVSLLADETPHSRHSPHKIKVPKRARELAVRQNRNPVFDLLFHHVLRRLKLALFVAREVAVERIGYVVAFFDFPLEPQQLLGPQKAAHNLKSSAHKNSREAAVLRIVTNSASAWKIT